MLDAKTPIVVATVSLLLATAACSGGPSGPSDTHLVVPDGGADVDGGGPDAGTYTGPDGTGTDGGGDVSDVLDTTGGDGDADADGGDGDGGSGCRIDRVDTDRDRDRDRLPDDCDNFTYLNHGGDNVEEARRIVEDESRRSNDSVLGDERNYDLESPFQIDGTVGPVEDDGDLDHYAFEIDKPTAILVHLEARTDEIWPGAVFAGRESRNRNYQPQLAGGDPGENATRGVFLPVPGRYVVAISDVRNLVSDDQAADVGGSNFEYGAHLSAVPLPETPDLGVPDATSHSHDGRLHAHRVDASDLTGLSITATGVAENRDSGVNPSLALYDPDSERTLAYTIRQQISQDRRVVSLTTRLEQNYDELYVVDSYISRFGDTSTKVDLAADDAAAELESLGQPRDERGDGLTWLQPDVSIDGMIGPPRTDGPTSLSPDVDYYLLSAKRGQTLRVTVTPDEGSKLQPEMVMGWYIASSSSSYFNSFGGHQVPAADRRGDSRSIEFLFNSATDGELAFRLRHAPNSDGDSPVGGDNFSYSMSVESLEPAPTRVSPVPGTAAGRFGPGDIGLFAFDAPQGEIVRVRSSAPDDASLDLQKRLTRTTDWRSLGATEGAIEFYAPNGETYWYDVRDEDGRDTDGADVTVDVQTRSVESLGALPATADDELTDDGDVDYYTFQGTAGERYDVRLRAEDFSERIAVHASPNYRRVTRGSGGEVFRADRDTTYVVRVRSNGSGSGSYTLGVQNIEATEIPNVPGSDSGTVDDIPFPDWYKFDAGADSAYQISLQATVDDFDGRVAVFDGRDMSGLQGGGLGTTPVRPGFDDPVYVAVFEGSQGGSPDYEYELAVRELTIASIQPGQTVTDSLGSGRDRVLYTFGAGKGAVDVDVEADGPWTPKVRLVQQSDLDEVDNAEPHNGHVHHARPESGDYGVLVRSHDGMRSGPLDYSISVDVHGVNGNISESEPNDGAGRARALSSFPAAVSGSIGSNDARDYFELPLQTGQRVWLIAIPHNRNDRFMLRPELELLNPDGAVVQNNQYNGYGLYPILQNVRADASGTWQVRLSRGQTSRNGDYALYVFLSDAHSASDAEPNDDRSNAQDLGRIGAPTRIEATVDAGDPTDVYSFELTRDLDRLNVSLEDAPGGHNLELTDNADNQLAASGPDHDGAATPELSPENLAAGTHYLEVGRGNGGGDFSVIMEPEP